VYLNTEVSVLLTASQAAAAAMTAAYEDIDVDMREIVGDADPLTVAWCATFMANALLSTVPPVQARELLASWGERIAHSAATHPDMLAAADARNRPEPQATDQETAGGACDARR
jgi:hypothetical protein